MCIYVHISRFLRDMVWLLWLYRTANDFWQDCTLITIKHDLTFVSAEYFFKFWCALFNNILYFTITYRIFNIITSKKFIIIIGIMLVSLLLLPVAIAACVMLNVSKILLSLKILFQLYIFLSRVVPHFLNKQRDIRLLFVAQSHCSVYCSLTVLCSTVSLFCVVQSHCSV